MSETSLPLPNPDFDNIKQSLKNYLKTQDTLKDYDFDGSVINVIIDLLSYNTHLNSFWLNMIANESFLQTAQKRSNIVAHAKTLNYIPVSAKCAYTDLYLEYEPENNISSSIIIPSGTTFLSSSSASSFTFNLLNDVVAVYSEQKNRYIANNARVYEGRLLIHEFTVVSKKGLTDINTTDDVTNDGVSVPNLNIDTSLLKVYIDDASDNTEYEEYFLYDNSTLNLDETSRIYFLSEDEFGYPKITFGDGKIGRKPSLGSKIKIVYLISSGPGANGIAVFNQATPVQNAKTTNITALYPSGGGSFGEDSNNIKYNALLSYEAQGRAVTLSDYEFLTKQIYPNYKSVTVWSGQDNNPPEFGKVFISIQPKDNLILTEYEKKQIIDYIKQRNILTIRPIIVDPDYLYVNLIVDVYLNKNLSNSSTINQDIISAINNYIDNKVAFDTTLEYSRLSSAIDSSNKNILSNTINFILIKNVSKSAYIINFNNSILKGSLNSELFSYNNFANCKFIDKDGIIQIVTSLQNNSEFVIQPNIGEIDYEAGTINFDATKFQNNDSIKIYIKPSSYNLTNSRNGIINISDVKINLIKN